MASDIYNIPAWATTTSYKKHDIVTNGAYHYYATVDHTSDASSFTTDLNAGKWDGVLTYNGETKPLFFWKTSYNYTIESAPRIKTIKFGDGYSQDLKDGVNNILLTFNFSFNDRSLAEHRAIIHFLHARQGFERFFFTPPQPYATIKRFICKEWQPSQAFIDNYSLSAKFEERAI